MAEVQLSVSQTKLTLISPKTLVGTSTNYDKCKFTFGSEWDGYTKTAIFYTNINTEPLAILLDDAGTCTIPWEPLQNPGILYIGVFGIKDGIEIPTNFITLRVMKGAAGNNVPPPPSLDIYTQIINKIQAIRDEEDSFVEAENIRESNENQRVTNESTRQTNEATREQNEAARQQRMVELEGVDAVQFYERQNQFDASLNDMTNRRINFSNLKNKTWVAIGDSITEVNFRTTKNYHKYISEWTGCTVVNYGISGSGFYNRNGVSTQITESPDLITVFLGTNDWANITTNNKALGAFGDTGTTTIAGCIDTLLSGLITKFPTKPIAVFTPLPRANNWGSNAAVNSQGYTLEQLANMVIKICNHYSIPCLDLYHNSDLFVWNTTANKTYFSCSTSPDGDGLHPNELGHEKISYKVLDFLNGIMGTNVPIDIDNPVVTASPSSGTYSATQSVVLTANEPATIYYTLDGSTPTESSSVYSSPISVSTTKTIKYFAKDASGNVSGIQTATYTIQVDTNIVTDYFNRADNASSAGSTSQGQAWSALLATGAVATWGISNNTLYPVTSGDSVAFVDSGQSDNITVEGKFVVNAEGSSRLAWRVQDYQNYFVVQESGGTISFFKRAGSWSSIGTVAGNIANGDVVKVKLTGSKHEIYLNGALIYTITDSSYQTATKHGFGSGANATTRFDDFKVYNN